MPPVLLRAPCQPLNSHCSAKNEGVNFSFRTLFSIEGLAHVGIKLEVFQLERSEPFPLERCTCRHAENLEKAFPRRGSCLPAGALKNKSTKPQLFFSHRSHCHYEKAFLIAFLCHVTLIPLGPLWQGKWRIINLHIGRVAMWFLYKRGAPRLWKALVGHGHGVGGTPLYPGRDGTVGSRWEEREDGAGQERAVGVNMCWMDVWGRWEYFQASASIHCFVVLVFFLIHSCIRIIILMHNALKRGRRKPKPYPDWFVPRKMFNFVCIIERG